MSSGNIRINLEFLTAQAQANTDALKKSFGGLSIALTGINSAISIAKTAFGAMNSVYNATIKSAVDLQKNVAEINTLLGDQEGVTEQLTKEILDFQKVYGADATTTAKAYYTAISSGAADATNAQKLLDSANKLSIGGVTDVETAVKGMTSAMSGYGLTVDDSARISDAFFIGMKAGQTTVGELSASLSNASPTAAALGVSLEETVAAMSALTLTGDSTSVASNKLKSALQELNKPGKELQDAFDKAGIASAQLSIEQIGLEATLKKIVGTTDGTAASIGKLFGSSEAMAAVFSLTGKQAGAFSDNLNTLAEAAKNSGNAGEEAFQKIAKTTDFQMKVASGAMQAFMTEIGIKLEPLFVKLLETFSSTFNGIAKFISDNEAVVDAWVNALANSIETALQAIQSIYNYILDNQEVFTALAVGIGVVVAGWAAYTAGVAIATVATTAMATAVAVLASPLTLTVVAVASLTAGLTFLYRNTELVISYFQQLSADIIKILYPAINIGIRVITTISRTFDAYRGSVMLLMGTLGEMVNFILKNVIHSFDSLLEVVGNTVGIFNKDLKKSIDDTRKTIDNMSKAVGDSVTDFKKQGQALIEGARDGDKYISMQEDMSKAVDETISTLEEASKENKRLADEQKNLAEANKKTTAEINSNVKAMDSNTKVVDKNTNAIKTQEGVIKKQIDNQQEISKELDKTTKKTKEHKEQIEKIPKSVKTVVETEYKTTGQQPESGESGDNTPREPIENWVDPVLNFVREMNEAVNATFSNVGDLLKESLSFLPAYLESSFASIIDLMSGFKQYLEPAMDWLQFEFDLLANEFAFKFGEEVSFVVKSIAQGIAKATELAVDVLRIGTDMFRTGMAIISGEFIKDMNSFLEGFAKAPSSFMSELDKIRETFMIFETPRLEEAKKLAEEQMKIEQEKFKAITAEAEAVEKRKALLQEEAKSKKEALDAEKDAITEQKALLREEADARKKALDAEKNAIAEQKALLQEQNSNRQEKIKEISDNNASIQKSDLPVESKYDRLDANSAMEETLKQEIKATEEKIKALDLQQKNIDSEKKATEERIKSEELSLAKKIQSTEKEVAAQVSAVEAKVKATDDEAKALSNVAKEQEKKAEESLSEAEKAAEALEQGFEHSMDALIKMIPNFVQALVKTLPRIVDKVVVLLPKLIDTIVKALPSIIDALVTNLPILIKTVISALPDLFKAIIDALPSIIGSILDALPSIIEALGEIIPHLISKLPDIIMAILDRLPMIIMSIIDQLPKIIGAIIGAIPKIITSIIIALPQIIISLITGIIKNIPSIIKEIAKGLWDSMFGNNGVISQAGKVFTNAFKFFQDIGSWFVNAFHAVVKFFGNMGQWFVDAFHGVVKFFKGIVSWFAGIFDGIANFFKGIGGAIGKVFGFSQGGVVQGKAFVQGDSDKNDVVPAMLSPGEIVIPRSATQGGIDTMITWLESLTGQRRSLNMSTGGVVGRNITNKTTLSGSDNYTADAISNLENKIERLGVELIKHTKRTYDILDKFDVDGMPATRRF
jgi:TP901 family phage tail tape measure protein